jgi:hypothetical protein
MTTHLESQPEYDIAARRFSGSRDEKLEQIETAIQELLDIKLIECARDQPNVRFVAARRRSHWFGMTVTLMVLLIALVLLLGAGSAHAQEPPADTSAQPPAPAVDPFWTQLKFGATLEGFYEFNANRPEDRVIPLRAYDQRANTFGIQQAAVVVEQPTDIERGRRFGLRFDFQYGQAVTTLQGSAVNEPRPDAYRNLWQAYGTYVFPVGRGLQVDFGKFASNLGFEGNYAKDQFNFSRGYLFNFLPYYHSGLRASLPVSDKVTVLYMLTNGIQQTEDFNNFKSNHFTAIVRPVGALTWTTSYYFGQEQPDNRVPNGPDGWFRVFDTNGSIAATKALTLALDVTHVTNDVKATDAALALDGQGGYARYQVTAPFALALRYEHIADDGLFAAVAQRLHELTTTAEYKLADGFLVRGEFRKDWSNVSFFPVHDAAPSRHQNTALVGLVWWIGNRTGGW